MKAHLGLRFGLAAVILLALSSAADAAAKVKAVASFSILGDMVKQVGGDRVEVVTLVGPDGDAHVFSPTPADAKALASAEIFFVNGIGFEGWMERLEKSSGFRGAVVVASKGVKPLTLHEGTVIATATTRRSPTPMPGRTSPTARSMSPISVTG